MTDAELMKESMLRILKQEEFEIVEREGKVYAYVFEQARYYHAVGQAMIRRSIKWPENGEMQWKVKTK